MIMAIIKIKDIGNIKKNIGWMRMAAALQEISLSSSSIKNESSLF